MKRSNRRNRLRFETGARLGSSVSLARMAPGHGRGFGRTNSRANLCEFSIRCPVRTPCSAVARSKGHRAIGVDIDPSRSVLISKEIWSNSCRRVDTETSAESGSPTMFCASHAALFAIAQDTRRIPRELGRRYSPELRLEVLVSMTTRADSLGLDLSPPFGTVEDDPIRNRFVVRTSPVSSTRSESGASLGHWIYRTAWPRPSLQACTFEALP